MKKFEVLPSDISRVEADESEFDAPTENMPTIMPLLYLEEQEKILEKIASKDTKIITEGFRYLYDGCLWWSRLPLVRIDRVSQCGKCEVK